MPNCNYKQLCADLIDALDSGIPSARIRNSPLASRARAALAESEPEGPTDEELRQLYCELFSLQCSPASLGTAPVRFARAILARWGNPTQAQ